MLHWLTVVTVGAGAVTVTVLVGGLLGAGMATARTEMERMNNPYARANIVKDMRGWRGDLRIVVRDGSGITTRRAEGNLTAK